MRRADLLLPTAAALLMTAGCGQPAETGPTNGGDAVNETIADDMTGNAGAPEAATAGQDFVNAAAASDAFEIESSKLALDRGQSAAIKEFARDMIAAHTESTAKLKAAASGAQPALVPDPALTAEQQAKLSALGGKSGADFDTVYAAEQVAAHEKALAMLQAYADTGTIAPLKDFAAATAPVVKGHLDMAKALKP